MHPYSSPPLVEPSEFHGVDPATILYINNNLDWVNAPIPAFTPVFWTSPPVAGCNPVNNQLAKALWQLLENLNRGSAPKPLQSKARILDTFDGSLSISLLTLFSCQPFAISHWWRENQFCDDLPLWCSTRLVWSRTIIGRSWLCTTLAFHLAPFCGRAPGLFQTLGPSRGCRQSHRQPLHEAKR